MHRIPLHASHVALETARAGRTGCERGPDTERSADVPDNCIVIHKLIQVESERAGLLTLVTLRGLVDGGGDDAYRGSSIWASRSRQGDTELKRWNHAAIRPVSLLLPMTEERRTRR